MSAAEIEQGMKRPEPMQPAYDFERAPDTVSLLKGTAELVIGDDRHYGPAEVLLRLRPSPRVIVRTTIDATQGWAPDIFIDGSDFRSFALDGQAIEGFSSKWRVDARGLELDWCPSSEPMVLRDMATRTSVSAVFHLFNFPDFWGGQHQAASAPAGCHLLELNSDEWRISLQSLPMGGTEQAWVRIKDEGGCWLTHLGRLERTDGKSFTGDEATEQLWLLSNFLSFTKGGRCRTVCEVGLDATGARTWETFVSPKYSNPPNSWFNPSQSSQAEILFPLFAKRWQQSEEWRQCLRAAIYWYTQANTSGGSPGIDAAIILAQAALERLAHHHLVVDRKMISAQGLDLLKASDRMRLLLSSLHIPTEIGTAVPAIKAAAQKCKWIDATHALTDIRNELVHPVSRKQVDTCIFDAWRLSLWYLELTVLAMCGYGDTYTSRLTEKYVNQSGPVPWGRKG